MADDITVKDVLGADKIMAADDVGGGRLAQIVKIYFGADGIATLVSSGSGAVDSGTMRVALPTDDPLTVLAQAGAATSTTTITRPADTNVYAGGDSWSSSTSAPAVPVISGASRGAGKSGVITDIFLSLPTNPSTPLQGELWFFDAAPTGLNDNGVWALSDADLLKCVGVEEFTMKSTGSSASSQYCHLKNLNLGFTTPGSADLWVIPKVTNAYLPAASEALTLRTKIVRTN